MLPCGGAGDQQGGCHDPMAIRAVPGHGQQCVGGGCWWLSKGLPERPQAGATPVLCRRPKQSPGQEIHLGAHLRDSCRQPRCTQPSPRQLEHHKVPVLQHSAFRCGPLQVRYLKVTERSGYQALPWVSAASLSLENECFLQDARTLPSCCACLQVRYITTAGDYEIRMGA